MQSTSERSTAHATIEYQTRAISSLIQSPHPLHTPFLEPNKPILDTDLNVYGRPGSQCPWARALQHSERAFLPTMLFKAVDGGVGVVDCAWW